MSYVGTKDYLLEVAKGNISGTSWVNKFGRNAAVSTSLEDIWDGSSIWVAPTQARGHTISSTVAGDSAVSGTGARTIQIYGLTGWDQTETTETLSLAGTSAVYTVENYVIIHRMKVLTKGTIAGGTSSNIGTITAQALTDQTVTAQISPGRGQTLMAIYGIPSTKTAYMTAWEAAQNRTGVGVTVATDVTLVVNPEPDAQLLHYINKHTMSLFGSGTTVIQHQFAPYFKIPGPAIVKVQAIGSAAADIDAGFDMIIVDN